MRDVLRFEILRWVRTRRLLVLAVAFVFSALTGPIMTAYAEEIFGAVRTSNNLEILFETPTWIDGGTAYLQNAAQVSLLFACFLVARCCSLGQNERLGIHYRIRARTTQHLFGPRLLISLAMTWATALLGLTIATYQIAVLFDDVEFDRLLSALLAQSIGIVMVAFLAGAFAARTNAPGTSALIVYFTVFIGDLVRDASWIRGYSPTALLRPTDLLETAAVADYTGPAVGAGAVIAVSVAVLLRKPFRAPRELLATNLPLPFDRTPSQSAGSSRGTRHPQRPSAAPIFSYDNHHEGR